MKRHEARAVLRRWVRSFGYRQACVAAAELGLDSSQIGRIMRGERGPSLELAFQIEDRLARPNPDGTPSQWHIPARAWCRR